MKCPQRYNGLGKNWKKEDYEILMKEYPKGNLKNLSKKLGCSIKAMRQKANILKLKRNIFGNANPNWKGNNVGYNALHAWIRRNKPKPKFCEKCKKVEPYDVANISQKYLRDLDDWEWLCRSCHMKKDGRLNKLHEVRKLSGIVRIVKSLKN